MKILISSVMLLIGYFQASCNHAKLVNEDIKTSDSVMYAFIHHVLKTNEEVEYTNCKYLMDKFSTDSIDSSASAYLVKENLLSQDDIDYMNQYVRNTKKVSLNPYYFNEKKIIPFKEYFSIKRQYAIKDREKDLLCVVGLPLFSKDRSSVLISISLYCGIDCARGRTFLYKKIDGQYILQTIVAGWFS